MLDRWIRSPSTIIVLLMIVFCCGCSIIWFVMLRPEPVVIVDLSEALLKQSDSPILYGASRVPTDDCNRFMVLADELQDEPKDCAQVQLTSPDNTRQYLNAAWEYTSVKGAEEAARLSSELPELGDRVWRGEFENAPQIGSNSVATYADISSLNGQIYVRNVFWTHKNFFFRLTVISREKPIEDDILYALANIVESRMP